MSKPTTDVLKPMRVDREFSDFLKQTKQEMATKLNVDSIRIPNPMVTKQIVGWAKLGKFYENNKQIDPVTKVMNRLMK